VETVNGQTPPDVTPLSTSVEVAAVQATADAIEVDTTAIEIDTTQLQVDVAAVQTTADAVEVDTTALIADVADVQDVTEALDQHPGDVWYISTSGDDSDDGGQGDPWATFSHAVSEASAGDRLIVKAGTYTETGIDISKQLEVHFRPGVIIDPASGTALTLSANNVYVDGMHKVTPAGGAVGVLVSGAEVHLEHGKVVGGATCVHVTGAGCMMENYAAAFPTATAYSLQGAQGRLTDCKTVGNASTKGYSINGGADTGVLDNCTSAGHADSGYHIDTGSQDWTVKGCSSGGGDGARVDVDGANVWDKDFSFDDEIYHTTTFTGGGGSNENLFKITGTVLISALHGTVGTVLAADVGNGYLRTEDGANLDITDSPGPDFSSLPSKSNIHKIDDAGVQIALESSAAMALYEDATKFGEDPNFQLTAKAGVNSYINFLWSGNAASGSILWHCHWEPISDDGFVEAA